ncbi:hypothetical protein [Mesorhizobium sp. B2-4-17]|uniref:hypothetical protein n=1 Tax=Mesorhizobium sp. B2-4-17 TaxID=2589932 RepID=UPI00112BA56A|nr:hypothetical protein [Mesorhizobium sp. B2-4-17]TPK78114.1 hypothetical protein FJ548_25260 [Mesorhizobium sp. B2-4-17]
MTLAQVMIGETAPKDCMRAASDEVIGRFVPGVAGTVHFVGAALAMLAALSLGLDIDRTSPLVRVLAGVATANFAALVITIEPMQPICRRRQCVPRSVGSLAASPC